MLNKKNQWNDLCVLKTLGQNKISVGKFVKTNSSVYIITTLGSYSANYVCLITDITKTQIKTKVVKVEFEGLIEMKLRITNQPEVEKHLLKTIRFQYPSKDFNRVGTKYNEQLPLYLEKIYIGQDSYIKTLPDNVVNELCGVKIK